ncbi:glycoside hydrolase family 20 zincin-like fold domain-containing protein [Maribacter sp. HTCC2170]|uniref:glycoside hydrolase family 20 zincin-like fold domain-containing protein n=1 Tax=Maribacter sp. (strain HTCC2170 / KCCM 42371) TaxID=313603 RepID=UPI00006BD548|nr:glycoside hydrolase family 20 zincin-like fold domain-containing protein [Maribacter sp. HTCC2170]EAR02834.1 beta-N-acetylhexosaminidase [Maribacter sp. HTCC2170]
MRKTCALFVSLLFLISCKNSPEKLGDFEVLPLPQKFEINGVSSLNVKDLKLYHSKINSELPIENDLFGKMKRADKESKAQLLFEVDNSLDIKDQGYLLKIDNDKIKITGKDSIGLFYGVKTLEQLLIDSKEQEVNLPVCTIEDYPLLAYRAVHLDVKHHLEKEAYYYDLIDKLAGYKVNAIILEIEDKLKFTKQPKVSSMDAWSIEKWKKLSDYAAQRHISISPLVQGLGHASFILKHDEYKALRDNTESDWAFNPLDPKTYEVQFDLYLDAMEATPHGKYLHVGGDEVHTTGRDSGKSALELQLGWLAKVSTFAEKHGRIPIFWDDMPLRQADVYEPMFRPNMTKREVDSIWSQNEHKLTSFLDKFPKNCIYMRWNYSSPEAYGNTKAMQWFADNGFQVMGATAGQTRWVLMPQSESNMDNIKSFAVNSINSGLNGLLLTLWDDDSPHFELYTRGIIAFAEYTWSGEKRGKDKIKSAYRQREFSYTLKDSTMAFIDDLEDPVVFWKNALLKGNKRNYLKGMDNPIEEGVIDMPNRNKKGEWSIKYKERLANAELVMKGYDSISNKISQMRSSALRNSYSLDVYNQVNKLAHYAPKALLTLKAYDKAQTPAEELEAVKKLGMLKVEFSLLRGAFEAVYEKTRVLNKPDNYILDQDHHVHMANQSLNFDWQFIGEQLFLDKLDMALPNLIYLENAESTLK